MKTELIARYTEPENLTPRASIVMERVDGVVVGRQIIPVKKIAVWIPNDTTLSLINKLNQNSAQSERSRNSLTYSLNHNSPNTNSVYGHGRAVSAYFTHNPEDETVIIEWGTIDPQDEVAKLHDYLNQVIDLRDRSKRGMKISSGHIAKTKKGLYMALMDSVVSDKKEDADSPMGKVINTLYGSGFIPISAEGFVKLPAF